MRNKIFPIRLTEEEYKQIEEKAQEHGEKNSNYVRRMLYKYGILERNKNNEKKS